jgi:hypothetical protein
MPIDESTLRSDLNSDIEIHQLQQYLHCPGRIPTAPHPFVKQAARQAARHQSQPQRPPSLGQCMAHWRDCLALGGGVVYDVMTVGVPAVLMLLFRRIGNPAKRRLTPPQPRLLDADDQAAIVQPPRMGIAGQPCQCCSKPPNKL